MYDFGSFAIAKSSTPTSSSFNFHSTGHSTRPMMTMDEVKCIMKENEERATTRILDMMMSKFGSQASNIFIINPF